MRFANSWHRTGHGECSVDHRATLIFTEFLLAPVSPLTFPSVYPEDPASHNSHIPSGEFSPHPTPALTHPFLSLCCCRLHCIIYHPTDAVPVHVPAHSRLQEDATGDQGSTSRIRAFVLYNQQWIHSMHHLTLMFSCPFCTSQTKK